MAARVRALSTSDWRAWPELPQLVARMEQEWAQEPRYRAALALGQPSYLRALWQLRAAGFEPQNARVSVQMKARLVGPEIAGLEAGYSKWMAAIQDAAGGPPVVQVAV